ncbi:aminopeptidase N-like [Anticarsia gemmatalis]|uniref:aminopeptidase N-like n=1 Tax=Anticarsia gemmatalis TaxID=129554 RepID=UPI003F768BAC
MRILLTLLLACATRVVTSSLLLPRDLSPRHYHVKYVFDIDPATNFSFYGVVDITMHVIKPTSKIVLHAKDFTIDEKQVRIVKPEGRRVRSIQTNKKYAFLTINLNRDLAKGSKCVVTIPFYGNLKPGVDGAYISAYEDKKSEEVEFLIVTQFQPISARKSFPCFDEPMFKASFTVTIGHHKNYGSRSNMPLHETSEDNALEEFFPWSKIEKTFNKDQSDFVWDTFKESVKMSTYLLAFLVSKFSHIESTSPNTKTTLNVWARREALDQATYASVIGVKMLSFFEDWFNISYPLPKQDMVAIPDLSAGAMENWGLITYKEKTLLYDEKQSSFLNKESLAQVVAHELAHQWFGNLVTMKWWSDLWLNEGFATFAAAWALNDAEPTWEPLKSTSTVSSLLTFDSLESSHPVSMTVEDPALIDEVFDNISYVKGSLVINMMMKFLGANAFKKGIYNYLRKYSYRNAEQNDLWREMTAASKQYERLTRDVTVKEIMDTWTTQTGYPLLTVTRNYKDKTLTVRQKRYFGLTASKPSNASWWIPLSVLCEPEANKTSKLQWLAPSEGVTRGHKFEHGSSPEQWVLFNYDMIGFYRVNYDMRNWQLLIKTLKEGDYNSVPFGGRFQLISDAFALAWTNTLNYSTTLSLASYLQREQDVELLNTGYQGFDTIHSMLRRSADYGTFKKFMYMMMEHAYTESGGLATKKIVNPHDLKSVKKQIMTSIWASRADVKGCPENAIELFQQWMDTADPDENNPIPLDLRNIVYCVAVSRGSLRHWQFVLDRHQAANVASAKQSLLEALTCTNEVWILAQLLEWTVKDVPELRRDESLSLLMQLISSNVGYYLARDFFYDRIGEIHQYNKDIPIVVGAIAKQLLSQFTTQRELDTFMAWHAENSDYFKESKMAVEQGIETAKINIEWTLRNKKTVVDTLRELSRDYENIYSSSCEFRRLNNLLIVVVTFCTLFKYIFK